MSETCTQTFENLPASTSNPPEVRATAPFLNRVALLTGCQDRPYALGLADALAAQGVSLDFIGSDEVSSPELKSDRRINFLNLRGDQRRDASFLQKIKRILGYYARLIRYAFSTEAKVFHLLWNDKFEVFDRTLLKFFYRMLGRRLVFTAHNVNSGKRDKNDSWLNRLTLRIQYHLVHHIFVHTQKMKEELISDFAVPAERVSVIPLGINDTALVTQLTRADARRQTGLRAEHKAMLFFGRITPYKGLEFLIKALADLKARDPSYRLIIAGPIKGSDDYWHQIQELIERTGVRDHLIERVEFIPDGQVEVFFKAADVLILPYTHIFQSGLLSLGYSFGLPIIASDVGSLKEDIVTGETGFVCPPCDPTALAASIERYFNSDLYRGLEDRKIKIRAYAEDRFSWTKVGTITRSVYTTLCAR